tara:strand:- start:311 stop:1261 length:951 start_codon:yes stop_codon:yes gene_type:complete
MTNINTLVFSSGGVKGIMFLGCAAALKERGILNNITHYIGCSAGAIASAILAAGVDPREMFSKSLYIDPCDWNSRITATQGLIKARRFKAMLERFLGDVTLKELKPRITFSSLNLHKRKTIYLDTRTHPDLKLVDAVMMSCSIPILFPTVEYKGEYYVDGAVCDPFPIHLAENPNTTLGININPFNEYQQNMNMYKSITTIGVNSFKAIALSLFSAVMREMTKLRNIERYTVLELHATCGTNMLTSDAEIRVFLFHRGLTLFNDFFPLFKEHRDMAANDYDAGNVMRRSQSGNVLVNYPLMEMSTILDVPEVALPH